MLLLLQYKVVLRAPAAAAESYYRASSKVCKNEHDNFAAREHLTLSLGSPAAKVSLTHRTAKGRVENVLPE